MVLILITHETKIEKFQSGFSGMPGVSQNHGGSTKRRLQPILLLDEPLGETCTVFSTDHADETAGPHIQQIHTGAWADPD